MIQTSSTVTAAPSHSALAPSASRLGGPPNHVRDSSVRLRNKLLWASQLMFLAMILLGSAMELGVELNLVPVTSEVKAFLADLHSTPLIRGWVLVSNALASITAIMLAMTLVRFRRWQGLQRARIASWLYLVFAALFAIGQVVMLTSTYGKLPPAAMIPALMGTLGPLIFTLLLARYWHRKAASYDKLEAQ